MTFPEVPKNLQDWLRLGQWLGKLQTFGREVVDVLSALYEPPVVSVPISYGIKPSDDVVEYTGPGGHALTLPSAARIPGRRSRQLILLNTGSGDVTLVAQADQTVDGAASITFEAGSLITAASNGASKWSTRGGDGGGGGGSTGDTISAGDFSPALNADYFGVVYVLSGAGSATTGNKFVCSRPMLMTGIRFYWKDEGAPFTIRCKLWTPAGAVTSVDVAVSATGLYTGTFTAPELLDAYQIYAASIWETTGSVFQATSGGYVDSNGDLFIQGMLPIAPYTVAQSFSRYAAGDTFPASTSGGEVYLVDPLLEIPPP